MKGKFEIARAVSLPKIYKKKKKCNNINAKQGHIIYGFYCKRRKNEFLMKGNKGNLIKSLPKDTRV